MLFRLICHYRTPFHSDIWKGLEVLKWNKMNCRRTLHFLGQCSLHPCPLFYLCPLSSIPCSPGNYLNNDVCLWKAYTCLPGNLNPSAISILYFLLNPWSMDVALLLWKEFLFLKWANSDLSRPLNLIDIWEHSIPKTLQVWIFGLFRSQLCITSLKRILLTATNTIVWLILLYALLPIIIFYIYLFACYRRQYIFVRWMKG